MERYRKKLKFEGVMYEAEFVKRPFREGLEVSVNLPCGKVLRIAELGLGEQELIERICQEVSLAGAGPR